MQMGDKCKDCSSWEEEIFWTHFQTIHFSQFLRGHDFLERLEIPEKFAKHTKTKLPDSVTLKGPSGVVWDVRLTVDDDTLFFDQGWGSFVKDHSLVENDFLIFKYNGVSQFDVLMFDGQSLCEKPASYFVRKCGHAEYDSECQTKRKRDETPVEAVHNSSQCDLESSPQNSTNNDIGARPSAEPITPHSADKKRRKVGSSIRSTPARRSLVVKKLSPLAGKAKVKSEFEHISVDGDVLSPPHPRRARPATAIEKQNVFLMAQKVLNKEDFMVVMKPTHVARRFYLAVPAAWATVYLAKENQDVVLCTNGRKWKTRFYYHAKRDCGGLSGGWRNFASDNHLEEDDACVFKLANIGKKPVTLDVHIIRVLQSPLPLTQVPPTSSC